MNMEMRTEMGREYTPIQENKGDYKMNEHEIISLLRIRLDDIAWEEKKLTELVTIQIQNSFDRQKKEIEHEINNMQSKTNEMLVNIARNQGGI